MQMLLLIFRFRLEHILHFHHLRFHMEIYLVFMLASLTYIGVREMENQGMVTQRHGATLQRQQRRMDIVLEVAVRIQQVLLIWFTFRIDMY